DAERVVLCGQLAVGVEVPDHRTAVPGAASEVAAVGTEGHRLDAALVAEAGDFPTGPRLGNADFPVPGARGQVPAVGAEGDGENGVRVLHGRDDLAVHQVMDLHAAAQGAVAPPRGEELAVGAEGDGPDFQIVHAEEGEQLLARLGIPDPNRPVEPTGGDAPAVGAVGDALDSAGALAEGEQLLPRLCVPNLDAAVRAARDDPGAVG